MDASVEPFSYLNLYIHDTDSKICPQGLSILQYTISYIHSLEPDLHSSMAHTLQPVHLGEL